MKCGALCVVLLFASPALAEDAGPTNTVVVWPTLTPAGDGETGTSLHKPLETERELFLLAQELDTTLREAVSDLGFSLFVADEGPRPGHARDVDLLERAARGTAGEPSPRGTWVLSPRVETDRGGLLLRIVAVPPMGRTIRVRVERVPQENASVRALVMARDLLSGDPGRDVAKQPPPDPAPAAGHVRSEGRATLATSSALFGGFLAYSIERASGSDDPRVLYPLLALGTGVGLGGGLLAAEEWDIRVGDAWFLSAGALWGTGSGFLLANGRDIFPLSDRYTWGAAGGFVGLSLATLAAAHTHLDEGDAVLTHSGASLGLLLGGLSEWTIRGSREQTPHTGMAYGSALGLVLAGALATRVTVSPSRMLLIDAGAGVGTLLGAALGSPFVFENLTETRNRLFVGTMLTGAVAGGAAAWFFTREKGGPRAFRWGIPTAGIIGQDTQGAPAYGLGLRGGF